MTNETLGGLVRLTHMPDDPDGPGDRIGGQYHYDVEFTGGSISNVDLTDVTINGTDTARNDTIVTGAGDYTVQADDYVIIINKNIPEITTVTLPASPGNKRSLIIKDGAGNSDTFAITINGNGKNIDETATRIINTDWGAVELYFNGTIWDIVGQARGAGTGTVTSVALQGDNVIYNTAVTNSPITSTGTLIPVLKSVTAKSLLGNATAGTAQPTFTTSPVVSGSSTANTFVSTVATGTAPLTIASTTVVPNLYVARAALADTATTNANLTGAVTSVGNATSLGSFTSAQLLSALTDETGTGANVFAGSPTFTGSPILSTALATNLTLSQTASPAYARGLLVYDTAKECMTFFNDQTACSLQVGREQWQRVANNTGSTIANGKVVTITGVSGALPAIALAQANVSIIALGIATEAITNGSQGEVTVYGEVNGVDTSAFSAGSTLYVDATTPGSLTATRPAAPNYAIRVGTVGVSNAVTGTIIVNSPTTALGFGTANQIFGMNSAATGQEYKTVAGTANEINATNGANTLTFSLPTALTFTGKTITGGTYSSPTFVTPALGTPSSGVATNLTGTASGLTAGNVTTNANLTGVITSSGNATSFGTFTSAQILAGCSDETGTGAMVFAGSPTFTGTPILSTASATNLTVTGTTIPVSGIYQSAANNTDLSARTLRVLNLSNPASAVNYIAMSGSATTVPISLNAAGTDTDIAWQISSKGAGSLLFYTGNFGRAALLIQDAASSVNYMTLVPGATGTAPTLSVSNGSDSNINFLTVAKGTGVLVNAGSNTNTTASATNLNIDTSGLIKKNSSSARYKTDIENMDIDDAQKILELRPIWYRSKCEGDNKSWSYNGLLAEEVAELNPRWALWDYLPDDRLYSENGIMTIKKGANLVPDGIALPGIVVGLIALIQQQEKRINALEKVL